MALVQITNIWLTGFPPPPFVFWAQKPLPFPGVKRLWREATQHNPSLHNSLCQQKQVLGRISSCQWSVVSTRRWLPRHSKPPDLYRRGHGQVTKLRIAPCYSKYSTAVHGTGSAGMWSQTTHGKEMILKMTWPVVNNDLQLCVKLQTQV